MPKNKNNEINETQKKTISTENSSTKEETQKTAKRLSNHNLKSGN